MEQDVEDESKEPDGNHDVIQHLNIEELLPSGFRTRHCVLIQSHVVLHGLPLSKGVAATS